ncbi:MAG: DUF3105 domain-containing protein [Chloroflexi bacterium]|nr:DUF3105 domain-containing protein [Chloroflexota bacterium]
MSKKETRIARQAALRAKEERDRRLRLAAIGGAALIVVGGIVWFIVAQNRAPSAAPQPAANVSATEMKVPDEGRGHVDSGVAVNYQHYPPSSGAHWGSPAAPVEWGFHAEAVPPEAWVHNLEHGGIVALYHCPTDCPDTVAALRQLAGEVPASKYGSAKIVVTSDGKITSKVIALAWDRELDLSDFDRARLMEFYKRWVDQGPEDVP